VAGVLIDDGDNAAGATTAFRLAAHVAENGPDRRTVLPCAHSFPDIMI
jgi:hypothetical protein